MKGVQGVSRNKAPILRDAEGRRAAVPKPPWNKESQSHPPESSGVFIPLDFEYKKVHKEQA